MPKIFYLMFGSLVDTIFVSTCQAFSAGATGKMENHPYNGGTTFEESEVPKRKIATDTDETFGERLARFRKAAGYTQRDLAAELDISQRMVAYYEAETDHPPTKLLPLLAKTLAVSADELLGIKSHKDKRPPDGRLWRRFKELDKLPPKQRRQLVQIIDAFLERERLRRKARQRKAG
jgi:transcriptional regulator with XRE-family HTH domain